MSAQTARTPVKPFHELLADGRWWRLYEIVAALGLSRSTVRARLDRAIRIGEVESSCNGFRLVEMSPAVKRAAPLRGATGLTNGLPRAVHGAILPIPTVPTLDWSDAVLMVTKYGRRSWWPGVSVDCTECGGRLWMTPPHGRDRLASLYCGNCGREAYEVRGL